MNGKPQATRVLSLDVMRGLIMLLLAAEACGVYEALDHVFPTGPAHLVDAQVVNDVWHGLCAWNQRQPGSMHIAGP